MPEIAHGSASKPSITGAFGSSARDVERARERHQAPPATAVAACGLRSRELRHHFPREQPQALEHLLLRHRLDGVQQEVDAVDADRLPALHDLDDPRRVADAQPLRARGASPGLSDSCRSCGSSPMRRVRARRVRLARGQQLRREIVERPGEPLARCATPVSPSSWQYRKLTVFTCSFTNSPTGSHCLMRRRYSAIFFSCSANAAERQPEAAQPAVRRVELRAGAGHRHPHRRVRLLVRLRQDRARRHRERLAPVAEALLRPHLRQHAHDLVPRLLRVVGVGLEAAPAPSTSPMRPVPISSRPPERMSSTAARSAMRIGWLNCGTHTTMPWPTRMFFVCIAHAVRNSSGAEQCEYSSRK